MHNKIQAKLLLEATLDHLNQHQLTPTPDNYRLFFEYAAAGISELNADIDAMTTEKTKITQALAQQLYNTHIANNDQRDLDDTRVGISDMLSVIVGHLKDWDSSSSHFCETLDNCIHKLNDQPSLTEVKDIVLTVTDQAKRIRDINLTIKGSLHNLSDEITALRQDVNRLGSEALIDSLTQISNRRGFDIALKNILERAEQEETDCALIVTDVDHFKNVNDNFGHQVGDKILKFIATTLRKNIRGSDILARYGGEEFVIILPNTSYEGAMQVAENLRTAVSSRQLTTGSNTKTIGRMTISSGVSCYQKGETGEQFFDRTDKCMYEAKSQGRDRVVGQKNQ